MKKVLSLFAASMVASIAIADSGIEFKYLPTAGDKNAAGTEFTSSDKVEVAEGEVLAQGTKFTVYNAYKTTYKAVGMMTDTAYNTIKINDIEVDYKTMRIQGQDNPTSNGGNPGLTIGVPDKGACYRINVKEDGMIIAFIKSTPNKNFFAFDQVQNNNGTIIGNPIEYRYAAMANVAEGTYGNPNGLAQIYYKGDSVGNMLTNPETPQYHYNTIDATNGVGIIAIEVYKDEGDYIIGTGGSKIMACGFAFVPAAEIETLKITAVGCTDKEGKAHSDAVLYPFTEDAKEQDCGVVRNAFKINLIAPDEWIVPYDTVSSKDSTKWAYKCACYITEGESSRIFEMSVVAKIDKNTNPKPKGNEYTFTYKTTGTKFDVSFLSGVKFSTKDMCSLTVKDVTAEASSYTVLYNKDGKCTIKDVADAYDNEKDGPFAGLKSLSAEKSSAIVYNILGQRVAANAKGLVIINGKKVIRK